MLTQNKKLFVIGLGNKFRGDDGIGIYVAEKIKDKNIADVTVLELNREGTLLLDIWDDKSSVIVIDAVSSGRETGKIIRFNPLREIIPPNLFNYSTHTFSLGETIELAKTLEKLPKDMQVYGIEGKNYNMGSELSKEIKLAGDKVVALIEKDIELIKGN